MNLNELTHSKKDKFLTYLTLGLAVLLILTLILYFVEKSENAENIAAIHEEKTLLENELTELNANYDELHSSNDSLNNQLVLEQEKIAALLTEMKKFRDNSYAEITRYKKEVNTLKGILRSYVIQIDSLNQLNQKLAEENTQVKQQMDWVRERNDKLEAEQKSMKEVIARASALAIENFSVACINKSGKDVNLSKCYQLRADFVIPKNITTQRGTKMLYLRIIRPDDQVIAFSDNSFFKYQNVKLAYSARREIEYEGERLDPVSIYWPNDGSLIKGQYRAELFCDGENLGSTEFILK